MSDRSTDAPPFGDLLRRHRRARALTQEALAERAGVSARAISDLERGARIYPYRETAIRLAEALGLDGSERSALLAAARRPLPPLGSSADVPRGPWISRRLPTLIGRVKERDAVTRLLRDDVVRLLTLTGAPGVGKTSLALAAAADIASTYRDGVVFVDLAPLQMPDQVVPAIAAALHLFDRGYISLAEAIRRRLSTRQMLLVVDNFEHLLPAAPLLSDLLEAGQDVQFLVTSRAPLRLGGEREYPVLPLPIPATDASLTPETLVAWDVIRLFQERTQAAQPSFHLTSENAPAVLAICRQLDGLPLAIELAAARVKLLPPDALAARLAQRLPVLTAGLRDAPPRQRTLRGAIAWSYNLLRPPEQCLFRVLAVFAGGWTLDAAEEVGSVLGLSDILESLAVLVDHHLVARDGDTLDPRFRMLETVREFALEQVQSAGEEARARDAHLRVLLQLARENDLERLDAEIGARLERLRAEEANLVAGLEWGVAHDPETAMEILAALGIFWFLADRPGIGRTVHERVLATGADGDPRVRSRVLQQAAWLASVVGDFAALESLVEAARVYATPLGDERTLAYAQMHEGDLAMSHGDVIQAKPLLEGALSRFEALDDRWGTIVCLTVLAIAAQDRGDPAAAAAYFRRVSAITRECQLPAFHQAHVLANLGAVYRQLGRYEEAFVTSTEALRMAMESGRVSVAAVARGDLARLLLDRGEIVHAAPLAARSLSALWEIGNTWDLTPALELAAAVIAGGGWVEPAVRLFAAAASLREAMPYPIGAVDGEALSRQLNDVRAALGQDEFARIWSAAQAQPVEAIVAEARVVLAAVAG